MKSLPKLRQRTSWQSLSYGPSSTMTPAYRRTSRVTSPSNDQFSQSVIAENLPTDIVFSDRVEFLNNLSANIVRTISKQAKWSSSSHCIEPPLASEAIYIDIADKGLTKLDSDFHEHAQTTKKKTEDCYKTPQAIRKRIPSNKCDVSTESDKRSARQSAVSMATNTILHKGHESRCFSSGCDGDDESNSDETIEHSRHFSRASSYSTISSLPIDEFDSLNSNSEEFHRNFELEQARLNTVLSHVNPNNLLDYLKSRLSENDKNFTWTLSKLLPKKEFSGVTKHCVRCHRDYDGSVLADMTCILQHRENDVTIISEDGKCAVFQCDRCFAFFKLEGIFQYDPQTIPIATCGPCFVGKHTDDFGNVTYEPDGIVQRCSDVGCFVYFV